MHISDLIFPVRVAVSWILRRITRPEIRIARRGVNVEVFVRNRWFHNFQIESMRLVTEEGASYQVIGIPQPGAGLIAPSYEVEPRSKRDNQVFSSGETATYVVHMLPHIEKLEGKLVHVEIITGSGRCTESEDLRF